MNRKGFFSPRHVKNVSKLHELPAFLTYFVGTLLFDQVLSQDSNVRERVSELSKP